MKATLVRLSVCSCEHPLLKESIPLGTEYEIDPAKTCTATFTCGGCGREFRIECVWAAGRTPRSRGGYLPQSAFSHYQQAP